MLNSCGARHLSKQTSVDVLNVTLSYFTVLGNVDLFAFTEMSYREEPAVMFSILNYYSVVIVTNFVLLRSAAMVLFRRKGPLQNNKGAVNKR